MKSGNQSYRAAIKQINDALSHQNQDTISMMARHLECSEAAIIAQVLEIAWPTMQRRIVACNRLSQIDTIIEAHKAPHETLALGYVGNTLVYFDGYDFRRVTLRESVRLMAKLRKYDGDFDPELTERWEKQTAARLKAV